MLTSLKSFLLVFFGIYLVFMMLMYLFQRNLLYFPKTSDTYEQAHNYGLKRNDIVLRGWVLNEQANAAIIYFGGNAELIDGNIAWMSKVFPDHAVYLVNYRGYGGSDGKPTQQHLQSDALAVFDDISQRHQNISLYGRSLGTGVAVHVASRRNIHRMALVTPFDSILNVAGKHYPYLPVSYLLKDRWESWRDAAKVSQSSLVIYGGRDRVVPFQSTEKLIEHFQPESLKTIRIDEADHDNILGYRHAAHSLVEFLGGDTSALK